MRQVVDKLKPTADNYTTDDCIQLNEPKLNSINETFSSIDNSLYAQIIFEPTTENITGNNIVLID